MLSRHKPRIYVVYAVERNSNARIERMVSGVAGRNGNAGDSAKAGMDKIEKICK